MKPAAPAQHPIGLSRAKVAENLKISESQVARLEQSGLRKLRAAFERQGLTYRALMATLYRQQ
jgi:DNA-directed RNA polymerase sigma subunit (sigma70/sigma32)